MSEFADMVRTSLADAEALVGTTTFTIEGITQTIDDVTTPVSFGGVHNSFEASEDLVPGGAAPSWPAVLLCDRAQFAAHFTAPLEQSMERRHVMLDGRRLRIERVELDEVSIMLVLAAPGSFR